MNYFGFCACRTWRLEVSTEGALQRFNPRVCDCAYCQSQPSTGLISDPQMQIELRGDRAEVKEEQNGDRLATFYRCAQCGDLLAVGCELGGRRRGAVNAFLLDQKSSLGNSIAIQPRLLKAPEKLARWDKLWGSLHFSG